MLAPFVLPTATLAATPAESFERGKSRLSDGDLRGALKEYAEAARAAPENDSYLREFMLVRNAVLLKTNLTQVSDQKQWLQMAQALRAFYAGNGLLEQALQLDKQIHARKGSSFTAMQLAETQLALDLNADAENVLTALGTQKSTTASQALLAIALVRQGKLDKAQEVAKAIASAGDKGPVTLYDLARMHAALGNANESLTLLVRSFEGTLPSQLDLFKRHARKCPEFAAVADSSTFQKALETESKVPESKCSGGSSCASCPMSGQCSSAGGQ
jgi:tetratricopeptide (TPR) repeat protein